MIRLRTSTTGGRGLLLVLLVVLVVGCTAPVSDRPVSATAVEPTGFAGGMALPVPYEMPDQTLTDTSGQSYNLVTSPSRPVTLVFFGYTHCRDVCGDALSSVAMAIARLDAASRDQVQMLFITTDPARDTAAVMRAYLNRFDPSFIGLTSDVATIKAVAERVGVEIKRRHRLPGGGYQVSHSAQVVGFDRSHRGVVLWLRSVSVADLQSDLHVLVDRQR